MGAGRKTQTFTLDERTQYPTSAANSSTSARNLRKNDLGGVIFGCTHSTIGECLSNQIFGLPSLHISYVRNVEPGLPLFLFNYSDRKLYGIFEAASHGQMNINPYGWSTDGSERTQYPAQVRIRIRMQCQSLSEDQYKKIISDNYYTASHFWFELDHAQTGGLISLLESLPPSNSTHFVRNASNRKTLQEVPSYDTRHQNEVSDPLASAISAHPDHFSVESQFPVRSPKIASKWITLFKVKSDPCAIVEGEGLKGSVMEADFVHLDQSNLEAGPSDASSCLDEENQMLETHSDKEKLENKEELVYRKLKQLAFKRGHSNSCLEGLVKDTDFSCVMNDMPLENESSPTPPLGSEEKYEEVTANSFDHQSAIDKLRQEMETLKAFSVEQFQKTCSLEKKLVESDSTLQQLKCRVKLLESQLNPSTACVDEPLSKSSDIETVVESFDELNLGSELLFVMGGYDGNSWLSTLECYSPTVDVVRSRMPMSSVRAYASTAVLNGNVYIFGGGNGDANGNLWYDTVEAYNPLRNEWTSFPPLIERRGCLAGATLNNKIFAIGGGNGVQSFSDVEMFDPALGRWIRTQSMLQKRFAPAVAELNGVLYVVGGYDGDNYLKSAERFDPREVSWSRLPSLNTSRGCHALAILNQNLYALGGYDGTKMVSSVEILDPRMGSWIEGEEMKQSRGYSVAAVFGDTIYVIGGLNEGNNIADTVDCYKADLGWSVTNLKGIGKRCFFSAAVL